MDIAAREARGHCEVGVVDGTIHASLEWFREYSRILVELALKQVGFFDRR